MTKNLHSCQRLKHIICKEEIKLSIGYCSYLSLLELTILADFHLRAILAVTFSIFSFYLRDFLAVKASRFLFYSLSFDPIIR